METELIFATREDFQEWLKNYGQTNEGVWLLFGKTKTLKTLQFYRFPLILGYFIL